MKNFKTNPEDLEKLVHAALHDLPNRRAPESLMLRVQAAIAAREACPWWQRSFTAWPVALQAAFLGVSGVIAATVLFFAGQIFSGAGIAEISNRLDIFASLRSQIGALSNAIGIVFNAIPPLWLYGALGFFAAMYAALLGLGAAFYRTVWTSQR